MATNTGDGGRRGPITDRKQFQDEEGRWIRTNNQGRAIAIKQTPDPWKAVRKVEKEN